MKLLPLFGSFQGGERAQTEQHRTYDAAFNITKPAFCPLPMYRMNVDRNAWRPNDLCNREPVVSVAKRGPHQSSMPINHHWNFVLTVVCELSQVPLRAEAILFNLKFQAVG